MSQADPGNDETLPGWAGEVLSLFDEIVSSLPAEQAIDDEGRLRGYLRAILEAEVEERRDRQDALERLLLTALDLGRRTDCPMADRLTHDLLKRTLTDRPSIYTLRSLTAQIDEQIASDGRREPTANEVKDQSTNEESFMEEPSQTYGNHRSSNTAWPPRLHDISDSDRRPPPYVEQRRNIGQGQRNDQAHRTTRQGQGELTTPAPSNDSLSFGLHSLQKTLERQLSDVIEQNRNFGTLLNVEQTTLDNLDNIAEIDTLRQILSTEIDRLLRGQGLLQKKLENALKYVRILETEGLELNNQLARAHSLSLTDELTKLPNRRAFIRTLEDEVARVQRYGYPLSLALLDLDHFKQINDRHGHSAGDEVLRCFSQAALSAFRHHDMLARYGGEEFAILLPNTDIKGALKAIQKVRSLTRQTRCSVSEAGMELELPSFSGGIVPYLPGETPSEFIERADQALYQAKEAGRDRVVTGGNGRPRKAPAAKASNEQPA